MRWRYTLIDRTGAKLQVDEPINWDDFALKIKRHTERHGTFREVGTTTFKFIGAGAELLRREYELYGIRADIKLRVDSRCSSGWRTIYTAQVDFGRFTAHCDQYCSVSVGVEQEGALVKFINRFDQKVELKAMTAFDGLTPLTPLSNLVKRVMLPSKALQVRSHAAMEKGTKGANLVQNPQWFANIFNSNQDQMTAAIIPGWNKIESTSLQTTNFFSEQQLLNGPTTNHPSGMQPTIDFERMSSLQCISETLPISYRMKGRITQEQTGSVAGTSGIGLVIIKQKAGTDPSQLSSYVPIANIALNAAITGSGTKTFDKQGTVNLSLNIGDKLFIYYRILCNSNRIGVYRLDQDVESYIRIDSISKCEPTAANFYMVHEAASRLTEAITDGALQVKSEWYGRNDSAPFSFASNGCGALKALTMGMEIRNAKLSDGTPPKFFLSFKELFEGLSAIDNIGVGLEGNTIRMENWKWFYKDDVVLRCTDIEKLDRSVQEDEHYSVIKVGYEKWEAEDFNGLDELLTKREYRTTLSQVQNSLEKLSSFIASGYAFEVTRRKQNDTKDWRFDNDTFILCLEDILPISQQVTFSATGFITHQHPFFYKGAVVTVQGPLNNGVTFEILEVKPVPLSPIVAVECSVTFSQTGSALTTFVNDGYRTEVGNISSAANILDPQSVYNFRISPIRNLMRWFDRIASSYRHVSPQDPLLFTSGDGNYIAEGELIDTTGCKLEAGPMPENGSIHLNSFADPSAALPIAFAERISFEYPMSFNEYELLQQNPHGLIYFKCRSDRGYGWIDELEFKPEEGKATFKLIPKIMYG